MDYQKLAEQRNSTNNFARHVGITTTKIEHGYAEVKMELQPFHLNPTGIVHGGLRWRTHREAYTTQTHSKGDNHRWRRLLPHRQWALPAHATGCSH